MEPLPMIAAVVCLAVAVLIGFAASRHPSPGDRPDTIARQAIKVVQGVALLVVAVDLVALARGDTPDSVLTHVGYVVAAVAVVPLLVARPRTEEEQEPEPASLWVVAIAAATVAVVLVRLGQTS